MSNSTVPAPLDVPALARLRAEGGDHRIIDVRSPAEFEAAHIPGAYNVPLDQLGEHRDELARHVDAPVVLVCRSGSRASQAEQRLAAAGMGNVAVLDGGMLAWEAAGNEVNRGAQRWDLERQVRLVAGSLVLAGILASLVWPPARFLSGAVGLGLTVAALTNTCAMGMLLAKLPYNRATPSCDVDTIVGQLTGRSAGRR
jgi:rhodanese-related sulfurtransferase